MQLANLIEQAKIFIKAVQEIIDENNKELKFNTKKKAVVQSLNGNGTANLTIDGILYENIKVRSGLVLNVGQVVFVELPNNSKIDMFVDFIL